ncbi:MAG: hypothetical protein RIB58_12815 [Phycisphaerales bacterium]
MRALVGTMAWICATLLGTPGLAQDAADAPDSQPAQPANQQDAQPAAELPEAIRTLLLGATEPGRSGTGGLGVLAVEGSVLPERAGLIRRTPYGEWAFVFMGEDGQPRAMVLLPCRQLERMVESVEAANASAVRISGRLTEYAGVNYLLPTNYSVIIDADPTTAQAEGGDAEGDAAPGDGQPDGQPGNQPGDQPGDQPPAAPDPLSEIDPRLAAIAEALEAGRDRARSIEAPVMAPPNIRDAARPAEGGQGNQGAIETDVLQEGDRLLRRRARLERQRGLWTLRFDEGPGSEGTEAPVVVLPSAALRAMERSVSRYGDTIAFEVSGTIYRYGRQPYVLITMHFVQPLEGLRPRG